MSAGVRYFVWRDGRPRWNPGPSLRARGFVGKDLKTDSGEWLDLGAALAAAQRLNEAAGLGVAVKRPMKAKPREGAEGFVYALFTDDAVKVGFSRDPFSRVANMRTSLSSDVVSLIAVRGSRSDERRLHEALSEHRTRGEWFKITPTVQAALDDALKFVRPT
ncbi:MULTISPECIES: GIY-YIG nuclease family protein [unclassified Ancylobacter]|uniref:GIY-YIG nuclease family protein n=1 Tax=unclassified Ancylobacter TaxID=2626613 RepID=UPI002270B40C|nr:MULTISPECIES: GIY-YIG nuclease family protein [unclassified Ancylobacter]WAC26308.1 GIY-YIG nuclease family protein [Ancylobacter sp. SL191]WGD31315.1 GIY-YIG nuclease family protein [Ancylobacter sp. WKF20]